MSSDEEVIGRGSEIIRFRNAASFAEILSDEASLNVYKNSAWQKMVKEWRSEHPITNKQLTPEEQVELDASIKNANEAWKKIQIEKEKNKTRMLDSIKDQSRHYP